MKYLTLLIMCVLILSGCDSKKREFNPHTNEGVESAVDTIDARITLEPTKSNVESATPTCYVERVDTNGLIVLFPNYSRIDLVCGVMPQKNDESVILFAEAAYTGECLTDFKHFNIAGDHVSNGVKYQGYKCKRNTGAFAYYADTGNWRFCYQNYAAELDSVAAHHGAAFAQEMMIHKREFIPIKRPDGNVNVFRALCELDGRLCIIESETSVRFGDFKSNLRQIGVTEALYLDMGSGWNHAWYRPTADSLVELHPKYHDYCTNWITFFK